MTRGTDSLFLSLDSNRLSVVAGLIMLSALLGDGTSPQTVLTDRGKVSAPWQLGDLLPHASCKPNARLCVDTCYGATCNVYVDCSLRWCVSGAWLFSGRSTNFRPRISIGWAGTQSFYLPLSLFDTSLPTSRCFYQSYTLCMWWQIARQILHW